MKKLIFALAVIWGWSAIGAVFYPGNVVDSTGAILGLTNVPYYDITTPTTNYTFNRTNFYFTNLTTAKDVANTTVTISALNGQYWIYQSAPLVLTNTTGGFLIYTNSEDLGIGAAAFVAYTNLDIHLNWWIAMYPTVTNNDVVVTTGWFDGHNNNLPGNSGNFSSNTVVTYPSAAGGVLVTNRQTNLFINLNPRVPLGASFALTNDSTSGNYAAMIVNASTNHFVFNIGNTERPTGNFGTDTYFSIDVRPDHGGAPSVPNSESIISARRLAMVSVVGTQHGVSGNTLYYDYFQTQTGADASSTLNSSFPLVFRASGFSGASEESHYPGIFSTYVTTNGLNADGTHGTWKLGLYRRQSTEFEGAPDSNTASKSTTNLSIALWGGASNTVEVLTPAAFDSTVQIAGNLTVGLSGKTTSVVASSATNAPISINPTGWTNTFAGNATVYVTATAVAFTIKDATPTTLYTSGVLTATVPVTLQPNWSVNAASGLAGTAVPW